MQVLDSSIISSPIGEIQLLLADGKLCYLDFADNPQRMGRLLKTRYGSWRIVETNTPDDLRKKLENYFSDDLQALENIELDPGGTILKRSE